MTHLNIQQGLNIEVVTTLIIKKLYEAALSVPEPLEGELDAAYMSGNLQVNKAYRSLVEYLTSRFDDLNINVTSGYFIHFKDQEVLKICERTWGNNVGCMKSDVEYVNFTESSHIFTDNLNIIDLDLAAFKNITGLSIAGSSNIENIYIGGIRGVTSLPSLFYRNWSNSATLNKVIIGKTESINGASKNSGTTSINIFAVKEFKNNFIINDNALRRLNISNVYFGDSTHSMSLPNNGMNAPGYISNLYVHPNLLSHYQLIKDSVSFIGTVQSYDFENDPDGIFDDLTVVDGV